MTLYMFVNWTQNSASQNLDFKNINIAFGFSISMKLLIYQSIFYISITYVFITINYQYFIYLSYILNSLSCIIYQSVLCFLSDYKILSIIYCLLSIIYHLSTSYLSFVFYLCLIYISIHWLYDPLSFLLLSAFSIVKLGICVSELATPFDPECCLLFSFPFLPL